MSWHFHQARNSRIEHAIQEQKIDLDTLLNDPELISAVNQKLPQLTRFLTKHMPDLIKYALEDEIDDIKQSNAFNILLNFSPVSNLMSEDSDLMTLLINYIIEDRKSSFLALKLLHHLLELTDVSILLEIDQSAYFLKHLIDHIEIINNEDFLRFLFSDPLAVMFKKWLFSKIEAEKLLYSYFNQTISPQIQQKCLNLLLRIVQIADQSSSQFFVIESNNDKVLPIMVNLCNPDTIAYLLDRGLYHSFSDSFHYIYELSNAIYYSERMKTQMASIRSIISDNLESLCNYVQSNHSFSSDKRYAVELIILVIQVKKEVGKYIFTFSRFLFNLFFELQNNNFLHNVFLKLFKILTAFRADFLIFLKSTNILTLFPSLAEKRSTMEASYWGQLYKMTGIIEKMIEDGLTEIEIPEVFMNYIEATYKVQHEIKNNPYGGPLPSRPVFERDDFANDVGSFYHCPFVDSCDLRSGKDNSKNDSDDSDEESEDSPALNIDVLSDQLAIEYFSPPSSPPENSKQEEEISVKGGQTNSNNTKTSIDDFLSLLPSSSSSNSSTSDLSSSDDD